MSELCSEEWISLVRAVRRFGADTFNEFGVISCAEAEEIREQFYQQKMELISHLPPSLQKRCP